jgi:O-acetyl-ADP-ribose deacetylase (regulator of RNase III)
VIRYATGSAVGKNRVIAHVVNDVGAWGAGFTAALDVYPLARISYYTWRRRKQTTFRTPLHGPLQPFGLGAACPAVVLEPSVAYVVHLCAQQGLRGPYNPRPCRLDKLREALLDAVRLFSPVMHSKGVHMPRIGTGLGGQPWDAVEAVVAEVLEPFDVTVWDPT